MTLSPSSTASLHDALQTIVRLYSGEEDQLISTDFYFMPVRESGILTIFNDNDETIAQANVTEWTGYKLESFYDDTAADLSVIIKEMNTDGELERLAVWMPYSFVLVDEKRETICDVLLVDNDTLLVTDPLLQGLDEELDIFIEKLLSE